MSNGTYKDTTQAIIAYLDAKQNWLQGKQAKPWFLDGFDSLADFMDKVHPALHDTKAKAVYDIASGDEDKADQSFNETGHRLATALMSGLLRTERKLKLGSNTELRQYLDLFREGCYDTEAFRAAMVDLEEKIRQYLEVQDG